MQNRNTAGGSSATTATLLCEAAAKHRVSVEGPSAQPAGLVVVVVVGGGVSTFRSLGGGTLLGGLVEATANHSEMEAGVGGQKITIFDTPAELGGRCRTAGRGP